MCSLYILLVKEGDTIWNINLLLTFTNGYIYFFFLTSEVSSEVKYVTTLCFHHIGRAVVRIAKKGSETILHRGLTESAKHTEDNKA